MAESKEDALINAAFRRRTNDANADAHKIFSILYGLVIFIGGVAFSISHAIVPREEAELIKHLAEIYFTYLYWVSILWMTFCILDIIRYRNRMSQPTGELSRVPEVNLQLVDENERSESNLLTVPSRSNSLDELSSRSSTKKLSVEITRDVHTRRHALDSSEKSRLRTYVRHRKNSIVQHVIGYNYDDHSTAGGLYTRVGIGIFCLGTVIHSGLSILSNLENRSCLRWTALIDDLSRLLFSFLQFFFIFKHSNLIIRAHEGLARLAVIHIVVTNLCVWFRMVVIETTSQIVEVEESSSHLETSSFPFNHSLIPDASAINLLHRLLHFHPDCSNSTNREVPMTTFIYEGYMKLKPLLYPCTIEFSLMCLTLFFLIWENIGKTFSHRISDKASTKNVFLVNCHASIKGLFGGMIVFSTTLISIILYAIFRNKTSNAHMISTVYSIVILEIVNLCLLALSLAGTIWSLIKIRKLDYRRTTTRETGPGDLLLISNLIRLGFDDVLIIVSLAGIYLYSIFSAFAIISHLHSSSWMIYVKMAIILLEFVEGTVHALFILLALRKHLRRTNKHEYPAREMITLLITLDLSLWFEKTTTTTKHEANPFQLAFYHVIPWSIIAAIATPLQIFFRFHASVCLSHVWANMYHLPAYQSALS